MKNKKFNVQRKTPAVLPSGSFFCPEPRRDNGLKLSTIRLFHGVNILISLQGPRRK